MSHGYLLVALQDMDIADIAAVNSAVAEQMAPFEEGSWFQDGSRWDWWSVGGRFANELPSGPTVRKGDLSPDLILRHSTERHERYWAKWLQESNKDDDFVREQCYGIKKGEAREQYVARCASGRISALAFLRSRKWYERNRLGWFGSSMATECEIKAKGEDFSGVCLHTCAKTGAKIISFGEEDDEEWERMFQRRFIDSLPESAVLVAVDYHV